MSKSERQQKLNAICAQLKKLDDAGLTVVLAFVSGVKVAAQAQDK